MPSVPALYITLPRGTIARLRRGPSQSPGAVAGGGRLQGPRPPEGLVRTIAARPALAPSLALAAALLLSACVPGVPPAPGSDASRFRLLLSWSRVEPQPGVYDDAYLAQIEQAVLLLQRRGIYTVIDLHQDAWGPTLYARRPAQSATWRRT